MKDWWRPLSAIVGALTFFGVFFVAPMQDTLGEKADTTYVKECLVEKADKAIFDLTIKNIEEDVDEIKKSQETILKELRKLNGGGE